MVFQCIKKLSSLRTVYTACYFHKLVVVVLLKFVVITGRRVLVLNCIAKWKTEVRLCFMHKIAYNSLNVEQIHPKIDASICL